jgi:hypothetical protein
VFLDDALNCGQSYPGPLEIFLSVKALENSKKFVAVLHAEANTIVANED